MGLRDDGSDGEEGAIPCRLVGGGAVMKWLGRHRWHVVAVVRGRSAVDCALSLVVLKLVCCLAGSMRLAKTEGSGVLLYAVGFDHPGGVGACNEFFASWRHRVPGLTLLSVAICRARSTLGNTCVLVLQGPKGAWAG